MVLLTVVGCKQGKKPELSVKMSDASLHGASFPRSFIKNDSATQLALHSRRRGKVLIYSYGSDVSHHAAVVYFEALAQTFSFDVEGDRDKRLFLRVRETEWKPGSHVTFEAQEQFTFEQVYNHAVRTCENFGAYQYPKNTCQEWNNSFLKLFRLVKRTFNDVVRSLQTATTIAAAFFVVTFIAVLPKAVQYF